MFSSVILPSCLRKARRLEDLTLWLYLKSVSTGDFAEAFPDILGPGATGSPPGR